MDVLIRIDREHPPRGAVVPVPDQPADCVATAVPFAGWLGLLQALAEVLERAESESR